jgi:hypothetical protein
LHWPASGGTLTGDVMQVRINIRKTKGLIWLLGAGAFVFAGWTFYDIFTQKQDKHYDARSSSYFKKDVLQRNVPDQPVSTTKKFYPREDWEKLSDCLIDGTVREKEKAPDQLAKNPTAPPIDTIVQIGLIVWSPQPAERFAAITYKSGGGAPPAPAGAPPTTVATKQERLHLSEGDPLQPPYDASPYNGKVVKIDEQEVTFFWGEGEVTITPKLGRDGTGQPARIFGVSGPEEDPAAALTASPQDTTQLKPGHWIIGTKDRERADKDLKVFMDEELNVRTLTPSGGGRSSLELTDVKAGSLAAQFGAQKGDRIISVNGIPMNSVSGAVSWFKQNSGLPSYVVVYERNGKLDTVTIHSK